MKQKKATIKTIIPALEAASNLNISGTNLGAILGQHQINISTFCKEFNEASGLYEKGIPLPTTIIKYQDKTYSFSIKPPTFYDMFFQLIAKRRIISKKNLHDIMKYFCYLNKVPFDEKALFILFGSISSFHYRFKITKK